MGDVVNIRDTLDEELARLKTGETLMIYRSHGPDGYIANVVTLRRDYYSSVKDIAYRGMGVTPRGLRKSIAMTHRNEDRGLGDAT